MWSVRSIALSILSWIYSWFEYRDFHIFEVSYNFQSNELPQNESTHSVWNNVEFAPEECEYFYNITRPFIETNGACIGIINACRPSNVQRSSTEITYSYNNKSYILITEEDSIEWPLKVDRVMRFTVPISSVLIKDEDGEEVADVTGRFKRCMGPNNDFHGKKLPMSWVIGYEDSYIEDCVLELKNSLNQTRNVKPDELISSEILELGKTLCSPS